MLSLKFFISNGLLPVCSFFLPVRSVVVQLLKIFGNKKGCNLVSLTILYCNRAYSFTKRRLSFLQSPQDDTSFVIKFLGFASPPHDGFADKYSIIPKENLQAVRTASPTSAFSLYTRQNSLSSIFENIKNYSYRYFCVPRKSERATLTIYT